MLVHESHIRVRYADTDQMGYVYHARYLEYLEVGRTSMVRDLGIPYAEVEARGILMPVAELSVQYKAPAYYDELLRVRTRVAEIPRASFRFDYEILKPDDTLVLTAQVRLAFIDKNRNRPVRVPGFILELVEKAFQQPGG